MISTKCRVGMQLPLKNTGITGIGLFGAPISNFFNFHFRSCTGPVSGLQTVRPKLWMNLNSMIDHSKD